MSDKLISGLPTMDLSKLDFSYTSNLASGVQASIEENNRRTMEIAESAAENRRKMQDAIEQTAVNTKLIWKGWDSNGKRGLQKD